MLADMVLLEIHFTQTIYSFHPLSSCHERLQKEVHPSAIGNASVQSPVLAVGHAVSLLIPLRSVAET
jgi:hypothetical protein